ncbi:MAG: hypothetical protein GC159_14245 [Phycisphaera sp.]|nr:hypothetical protein [Phycisphaera sp.]
MKVYLDGKMVDADAAKLSVFDAAVQHGVGLFETMQAYDGNVFRLRAHVDRLIHSAMQLGLTDRLKPEPLCEAVGLTLKKNGLDAARVRLTVTGGDLSLLPAAKPKKSKSGAHSLSVLIAATTPTQYPASLFNDGVTVVIADPKANPFDPTAGHKTLNYWSRLRTLSQAAAAQASEALWFTVTNHLCGGSVSNALVVKDGQLHTPIARGEEPDGAIPSPVLPGVTRAALIEIAESLDIPVHRRMLTINDLLEADELMLTNSSWLVMPVAHVEKSVIGEGVPGPITGQLHAALIEAIRRECGSSDAADA